MASTIRGNDNFDTVGSSNTSARLAKAWVNFSSQDTVIRDSYNVSSITDNGLGRHTANFTTAMANTNYIGISGGGVIPDNAGSGQGRIHMINKMTTTHCAFSGFNDASSAYEDYEVASILIFGS